MLVGRQQMIKKVARVCEDDLVTFQDGAVFADQGHVDEVLFLVTGVQRAGYVRRELVPAQAENPLGLHLYWLRDAANKLVLFTEWHN